MKLLDELQEVGLEPNLWRQLAIITYELGDLAKASVYGHLNADDADPAYRAEARIALSDIIIQTFILAEYLDVDWPELERDGVERFHERMAKCKAGVI